MRGAVLPGVSLCGMKADDFETGRPHSHLGPREMDCHQVELASCLQKEEASEQLHQVVLLTITTIYDSHHRLVIAIGQHSSARPLVAPNGCGDHHWDELLHCNLFHPRGAVPLELEPLLIAPSSASPCA